MARRRRGHRKGSKAIPIAQTMLIGVPMVTPLLGGINLANVNQGLWNVTGIDAVQGKVTDPMRGIKMGAALIILSTVGGKIANRSGANRLVKKATGGMLKIA